MGRPNPGFEKRQRERKKAEKRKEKERRKAERQAQKQAGETSDDGTNVLPADTEAPTADAPESTDETRASPSDQGRDPAPPP